MAPLENQRLLALILLMAAAGIAICWPVADASSATSSEMGAGPPAGSATQSTSSTVRILAVFDQADIGTMERVMQKTLIALNKEKTAWSGTSWTHNRAADNASSSSVSVVRGPWYNGKRRKDWLAGRLTVESVAFSSQWWVNQTADDLGRLILSHRPVAVLALSADEQSVFRVALAAASFHLPVIGVRAQRGLDDSSFRVS